MDVFADLTVDTPGGPVALLGEGSTLAIAADRWSTLFGLARRAMGPRASRRKRVSPVLRALEAAGIGVSLRVRSREVARMEASNRTGLVARVLAVPGVEVRPVSLLRSILSRS